MAFLELFQVGYLPDRGSAETNRANIIETNHYEAIIAYSRSVMNRYHHELYFVS